MEPNLPTASASFSQPFHRLDSLSHQRQRILPGNFHTHHTGMCHDETHRHQICKPAIEKMVKHTPVHKKLVCISAKPGGFPLLLRTDFDRNRIDGQSVAQTVLQKQAVLAIAVLGAPNT